jgi:hypothetical protein
MRALAIVVAVSLAGCNQILGNANVSGPGGDDAHPAADACTSGPSCAPAIDASMACEQQGLHATSVSGTVYAPNGALPLYDVAVYAPTTALDPITEGVTCGTCQTELSGNPLVVTRTDETGHFELDDVPVGPAVPIVIQVGRWRRQITVATTMCADTVLPMDLTRMPRNRNEGDLPRIAIVTGASDAIECLPRKLGIDDKEITTYPGTGRVRLFADNGTNTFSPGFAGANGNIANVSTLIDSKAALAAHDLVLFSCNANPQAKSPTALANVLAYANEGGRLLFEHYHYQFMTQTPEWANIAMFSDMAPAVSDMLSVDVDQTSAVGKKFAAWLVHVDASPVPGKVALTEVRHSALSADPIHSHQWLALDPATANNEKGPQMFSFNTPVTVPATLQCGRVVFSDMHEASGSTSGMPYPVGCEQSMNLTPQEKVLAFMIFELSSCD